MGIGPVGAVVTPLLTGINRAADLCQGETLCGACKDAWDEILAKQLDYRHRPCNFVGVLKVRERET